MLNAQHRRDNNVMLYSIGAATISLVSAVRAMRFTIIINRFLWWSGSMVEKSGGKRAMLARICYITIKFTAFSL